jgi:hypothetical protein
LYLILVIFSLLLTAYHLISHISYDFKNVFRDMYIMFSDTNFYSILHASKRIRPQTTYNNYFLQVQTLINQKAIEAPGEKKKPFFGVFGESPWVVFGVFEVSHGMANCPGSTNNTTKTQINASKTIMPTIVSILLFHAIKHN